MKCRKLLHVSILLDPHFETFVDLVMTSTLLWLLALWSIRFGPACTGQEQSCRVEMEKNEFLTRRQITGVCRAHRQDGKGADRRLTKTESSEWHTLHDGAMLVQQIGLVSWCNLLNVKREKKSRSKLSSLTVVSCFPFTPQHLWVSCFLQLAAGQSKPQMIFPERFL